MRTACYRALRGHRAACQRRVRAQRDIVAVGLHTASGNAAAIDRGATRCTRYQAGELVSAADCTREGRRARSIDRQGMRAIQR